MNDLTFEDAVSTSTRGDEISAGAAADDRANRAGSVREARLPPEYLPTRDHFTSGDRRHLIGLLEQMASPSAELRACAAGAANAFIERHQRSWDEILRTARDGVMSPSSYLADLCVCRNRLHELTDNERRFVELMARKRHRSPRDIRLVRGIASRLCQIAEEPDAEPVLA